MTDMPKVSPSAFPTRGNWTPEQLKLAFHFYCQTPFGKLHHGNPEIKSLAKLIGRTPDALAMKLSNFASLDPSITDSGRKGLTGASSLDRKIWDEFHADWARLAVECEQLQQQLQREHGLKVEVSVESDDGIVLADFSGETRQALVQQRIKQNFFRRAVLSSYRSRCCISGVSDTGCWSQATSCLGERTRRIASTQAMDSAFQQFTTRRSINICLLSAMIGASSCLHT